MMYWITQNIHITSARDTSLPCRNSLKRSLFFPRRPECLPPSQAKPHSGLCLQADCLAAPITPTKTATQDCQRQFRQTTITTTTLTLKQKLSRNNGPTVSPLPSAATGLTLQTLSKPLPLID